MIITNAITVDLANCRESDNAPLVTVLTDDINEAFGFVVEAFDLETAKWCIFYDLPIPA